MDDLSDLLHEAGSISASFDTGAVKARVAQRRRRRLTASGVAAASVVVLVIVALVAQPADRASNEIHTVGSPAGTQPASIAPEPASIAPDPSDPSDPSGPSDPSDPSGPSDPSDPSDPSGSLTPPATTDEVVYEVDASVLESPSHPPQICWAMNLSLPPQCGGPDLVGFDWSDLPDRSSAGGTTWGSAHLEGTWDPARRVLTLTKPASPSEGMSAIGPGADDFRTVPCEAPAGGWPLVAGGGQENSYEATSFAEGRSDVSGVWLAWPNGTPSDGNTAGTTTVLVVRVADGGDRAAIEAGVRERFTGNVCVIEGGPAKGELVQVQATVTGELRADMVSSGIDVIRASVQVTVWLAAPGQQEEYDRRYGPGVVVVHSLLQPVS